MIEVVPIQAKNGELLWRGVEVGPKGGRKFYYQTRNLTDAEPSAWRVWCPRQSWCITAPAVGTGVRI